MLSKYEFTNEELVLLTNSGWSTAIIPAKAVGMNLMMMRFMGSGQGIIGIMMICYAAYNVLSQFLNYEKVFSKIDQEWQKAKNPRFGQLYLQKIVYILICIAAAVYLLFQGIQVGIVPF